jgi:3-oxoadipate enol-lactonase/4-carboxymuconolactone decarboxylase
VSRPVLVLGPSLGTSAAALWGPCAEQLADEFDVLAWDLPGHGTDRTAAPEGLTMADLAARVLGLLDDRGITEFSYAGDSVGGTVGLQLLLDVPDRVRCAVLLCTGARIGTPESWHDRIAQVRRPGTPSLVEASATRWFGPGFLEREPVRASALLHSLSNARPDGYAAVCGALAGFDVTDRLGEIAAPVLAVAGADDVPTPPESLRTIAGGVRNGELVVLPGVAHLAPIEAPDEVADLLRSHVRRYGAPDDPAPSREARA